MAFGDHAGVGTHERLTVQQRSRIILRMGGGIDARRGFWFQDVKALLHLLRNAIKRSRCEALGIEVPVALRVLTEKSVPLAESGTIPTNTKETSSGKRVPWDGVFLDGARVVVDECKLGGIGIEERRVLYRRLRAQAERDPASMTTLVPRITMGVKGTPDSARWRDLNSTFSIATLRCPRTPPERVNTASQLAEEALYYLTVDKPKVPQPKKKQSDSQDAKAKKPEAGQPKRKSWPPWPPPLSDCTARQVMSTIEVDDSQTYDEAIKEFKAQLGRISFDLADFSIEIVSNALRGWIDENARSGNAGELTVEQLISIVKITGHYLSPRSEVRACWHRLRKTPVPAVDRGSLHSRGRTQFLPHQPWRIVQPAVAQMWPLERGAREVLIAVGGAGKTALLADLYDEMSSEECVRVWIDSAATFENVAEALTWGGWATQLHGERLAVFLDSIEHASFGSGENITNGGQVLATIHAALNEPTLDCIVLASCRRSTWAVINGTLPLWREVPLVAWTSDRVRDLLEKAGVPSLPDALVDLLRSPFLLDLFLKGFGGTNAMLEGVSSRHGVLREYFRSRVLPETPVAVVARAALNIGVSHALGGRSRWLDSGTGVEELVSEGVLERIPGDGHLRFRHSLLRDFCAALELSTQTPGEIARIFARLENPLDRQDVLRALLERQLDDQTRTDSWALADLLRELVSQNVHVGAALGELDAPPPRLFAELGPIDNGEPLLSTIVHLSEEVLQAWCRLPAQLGPSPPAWLSGKALRAVGVLAAKAKDRVDSSVALGLASTLRDWTFGLDLTSATHEFEPSALANIGGLLARYLPDAKTAAWFSRLAYRKLQSRFSFAQAMAQLVERGSDISDEDLLAALNNLSRGDDEVAERVLLGAGDDCTEGLWSRYSVAVKWVLALSVASQQPSSSLASGQLVDDAQEAWGALHEALEHAVELAREDVVRAEQLCGAAQFSASLRGRLAALSVSMVGENQSTSPIAALQSYIEPMLADARIYRAILDRWSYYRDGKARLLWRALHGWWPQLSRIGKTAIRQLLQELPEENEIVAQLIAQWASAIPPNDRGAGLTALVDKASSIGPMSCPVEEAENHYWEELPLGRPEARGHVEMEEAHASACEVLHNLRNTPNLPFTAIDEQLSQMLEAGLFAGELPWLFWSEVRSALESTYTAAGPRARSPAGLHIVEQLARQVLLRVSRCRDDSSLWNELLSIVNRCIEVVAVSSSSSVASLRDAVLAEVDEATREVNVGSTCRAFVAVARLGRSTWCSEKGWQLLQSWARSQSVEVQEAGLKHALEFRLPGSLELVREVAESGGHAAVENGPGAVGALMSSVGLQLGNLACRDAEGRVQLDEWLSTYPRRGWLADEALWKRLLFGMAEAGRTLWPIDPSLGGDEGRRLVAFVELLMKLYMAGKVAGRGIVTDVLWPLRRSFSQRQAPFEVEAWSSRLAPLVCELAASGNRFDLLGLAHLRWGEMSPDVVSRAADALVTRGQVVEPEVAEYLVAALREVSLHPSLSDSRLLKILNVLLRHEQSVPHAWEAVYTLRQRLRSQQA